MKKVLVLIFMAGFLMSYGQDGPTKKKVRKSFEVEKEVKDGKEITLYTLTTEEDGEKEVIKWDGNGEAPPAIAEAIKESESMSNNQKQEREIIMEVEENGERKVMKFKGDGELPVEMQEMMNATSGDEDEVIIEKKIIKKKASSEGPTLGVMISESDKGIVVQEIMDDSSAKKAGVEAGDVLLKLDNTYILSYAILKTKLSQLKVGSKAELIVIRDGEEIKLTVQF